MSLVSNVLAKTGKVSQLLSAIKVEKHEALFFKLIIVSYLLDISFWMKNLPQNIVGRTLIAVRDQLEDLGDCFLKSKPFRSSRIASVLPI